MESLFAGGRIMDAILVLVAIEAVVLSLILRRRETALPPVLCNLASGAALMLALRGALTGAHWTAIAGCLALSGLAHGGEMVLRLGGRPHPEATPVRLDPHA